MDVNQDSSLFGMSMDMETKVHLTEAAKWGRFLAIVGFIMCGLLVIFGVVFAPALIGRSSTYESDPEIAKMGSVVMTVTYIIMAVLCFFSCLFLYRFAIKMKAALASNDQELLKNSFQNLKILFRYIGILTIVFLSIYALALIATLGAGIGKR